MVGGRFQVAAGSQRWAAVVAGEQVTLSGVAGPFTVRWLGDGRLEVTSADGSFTGVVVRAGDRVWVSIDSEPLELIVTEGTRRTTATAIDQDALAAPMAATVVRVNVRAGSVVHDGDVLVALEAMKMELPIRAARNGVVKTVHYKEGELVQPGAVVVELEPQTAEETN